MTADRNPSIAGLLLALVAVGLVAGSAALPWWSYDSSTGRKTPAGGPQDPSDTRVERHSRDFGPFWQKGDAAPSDEGGAALGVLVLGIMVATAGAALLLALGGEGVRFATVFPRRLSLAAALLGILGLAAALAWTWLALPGTMSGLGTQGAFTDRLLEDNYVRTALGPGWVLGALAVPAALGSLAFRFQAGSNDPAAVEAYA
jgi:hypothetical protein